MEGQKRDLSPGEFAEFMNDLSAHIMSLVNSSEATDKIGAITVIGTFFSPLRLAINENLLLLFSCSF